MAPPARPSCSCRVITALPCAGDFCACYGLFWQAEFSKWRFKFYSFRLAGPDCRGLSRASRRPPASSQLAPFPADTSYAFLPPHFRGRCGVQRPSPVPVPADPNSQTRSRLDGWGPRPSSRGPGASSAPSRGRPLSGFLLQGSSLRPNTPSPVSTFHRKMAVSPLPVRRLGRFFFWLVFSWCAQCTWTSSASPERRSLPIQP